ncbi:TerD family protein [Pseudoneobacillus sp. C159]
MINSIFLRRKLKVMVEPGENVNLPDTYLATTLKNLEGYGFTYSIPLMEQLKTLSTNEYLSFYQQLLADLKQMLGANVPYQPVYPNFPTEVMRADDVELYINAIIHYLTHWLPDTEAEKRPPLLDRVDLKVIELGNLSEFYTMTRSLLEAKTSISASDKADIEWVIAYIDDLTLIFPLQLHHKENLAFFISTLLKYEKIETNQISVYFKTATDVLRLATAFSNGDVSLAANTKYKKFKRTERRLLLALLEKCPNRVEDMLRHKDKWIRLGEILHPGEYKHRYPRSKEAFDILRNNEKYGTFTSKLEMSLAAREISSAVKLLKSRPGEFARRLDFVLRTANDVGTVLGSFAEVASEVATPVLLQVMTHFQHRNKQSQMRTIFPKGNVSKMVAIENQLPVIDESTCRQVVEICENALFSKFAELSPLGHVFIDDRLRNYMIPFSQRSASKALRTIVRGSKLPIPEGNTIRFFTWWKEGLVNGEETGRVDIDLSAAIYNEDWHYLEHISFTNLRSHKYQAYHSGDIVSAPNGACEFIDLDIESMLAFGSRYVVMSLFSYSEQSFAALPECFAGWMIRQHPNSGEIFEPSTVQDKIDLATDTRICIPVILDLVEKTVLWTDLALRQQPDFYNTIEANQRGMVAIGQAMMSLKKPNLFDLFMLHARARGVLVEDVSLAETVFAVDRGLTPFDIEEIMANYM